MNAHKITILKLVTHSHGYSDCQILFLDRIRHFLSSTSGPREETNNIFTNSIHGITCTNVHVYT